MDLYDNIQAIEKGETNATFKQVIEVAKEKTAARIQRYFLIDVLFYKEPDDYDKTKMKQQIVRKGGEEYVQYAKVQLSVKGPKVFPTNLINTFITQKSYHILNTELIYL